MGHALVGLGTVWYASCPHYLSSQRGHHQPLLQMGYFVSQLISHDDRHKTVCAQGWKQWQTPRLFFVSSRCCILSRTRAALLLLVVLGSHQVLMLDGQSRTASAVGPSAFHNHRWLPAAMLLSSLAYNWNRIQFVVLKVREGMGFLYSIPSFLDYCPFSSGGHISHYFCLTSFNLWKLGLPSVYYFLCDQCALLAPSTGSGWLPLFSLPTDCFENCLITSSTRFQIWWSDITFLKSIIARNA